MEHAHRLVTSRIGTATLAVIAALAAGIAVLVYVNHYRTTVNDNGAPASVLVAAKPIPKGMPVVAAVSAGYFEAQTLSKDQLSDGAVADAAAVRDQVATRDILPGEQITTHEFAASASGMASRLVGNQRAVAVAADSSHGVANQLQQGDHVDVLASFDSQSGAGLTQPLVKTLLQDIPVLAITHPNSSLGSEQSLTVVLRVTTPQAAGLAYSAENGKIWLVLRPRAGAPAVKSAPLTLQSLIGTR